MIYGFVLSELVLMIGAGIVNAVATKATVGVVTAGVVKCTAAVTAGVVSCYVAKKVMNSDEDKYIQYLNMKHRSY